MEILRSGMSVKKDYKIPLMLVIIILTYSVVLTYFSNLRFVDFFTQNWDLGIAQQMLWTTSHGHVLFETGDYIFFGSPSFLEIHPSLIAFLIVPLYSLIPQPVLLFSIQSLVVSSAIIPIYYLAISTTSNRKVAFATIFLYLFSFSILSAILFDFHWEAFIPLEFFSFLYLLQRGRYFLALIPFFTGLFTIEVFPFLAAGIVLYLAFDKFGIRMFNISLNYRNRTWITLLLYLSLSIISYLAITYFQKTFLPSFFHENTIGTSVYSSITGITTLSFTGATLSRSLYYWALLYASFLFIPLLHKRHLIMAAPWIFYSVFVAPGFSAFYGDQYSFVAISPILVGFIYGLEGLSGNSSIGNTLTTKTRLYLSGLLLTVAIVYFYFSDISRSILNYGNTHGSVFLLTLALIFFSLIFIRRKAKRIVTVSKVTPLNERRKDNRSLILLLVGLIFLSLILSPLNTQNQGATAGLGYDFQYHANPEFQYINKLSALIPENASVVACNNLFPYVANDPNAYSFWWSDNLTGAPYFPYNANNLPQFALIDSAEFPIAQSLYEDFFNQSVYGLRAYIFYNQFPGVIYLFEKGYRSNTTAYSVSPPAQLSNVLTPEVGLGPAGSYISANNSISGEVIGENLSSRLSASPTNPSNLVLEEKWNGIFATGWYQLKLNITKLQNGNSSATLKAVGAISGIGLPPFSIKDINATVLPSRNFANIVVDFFSDTPLSGIDFSFYVQTCTNCSNNLGINYVSLSYIGS